MKTKKAITIIALVSAMFGTKAQIILDDFETFILSPNSAYSPTISTPFQGANASFQYQYNASFQIWSGGFSYTNAYDSITGNFSNIYGVRALKGYTNSAIYLVGQDRGVITTTSAPQTTVSGFYITNTTYAYKSMAKGDAFARKFGDTTGAGSGATIPQGSYPDYFKVIVKGYKNGLLKNDSVTVMLADYTFTNNTQDFILSSWQFVNTAIIGEVDSIKFFMRSSDMSFGFINTPTFFAIDNFSTILHNYVGIKSYSKNDLVANVYPNPFNSLVTVELCSDLETTPTMTLTDFTGKVIYSKAVKGPNTILDLQAVNNGVYFLEITNGDWKTSKMIIKN